MNRGSTCRGKVCSDKLWENGWLMVVKRRCIECRQGPFITCQNNVSIQKRVISPLPPYFSSSLPADKELYLYLYIAAGNMFATWHVWKCKKIIGKEVRKRKLTEKIWQAAAGSNKAFPWNIWQLYQALFLCNICVFFQGQNWQFAFCPRFDKCHRRSQIFPVAFRRFWEFRSFGII